MKPRFLLLAVAFVLPAPGRAVSLERAAYESRGRFEPVIPAGDLERLQVAQETRRYEIEVREGRPWPTPTVKQKRQMLSFMAAGMLVGGLTAGWFGFLVGMAAGGMIWYMLAWAELMP